MAWEDDEPEEETGPLAVANALAAGSNGAVPDSVPDPDEGGSQPVSDSTPARSTDAPDDSGEREYMGQSQEQAPTPAQQSSGDTAESDFADQSSEMESDPAAAAAPMAQGGGQPDDDGEQSYMSTPIKAPAMPNFTPYVQSQGPGQMAAAKAAFNPAAYKPSVGRRILAGVAGFAGGAGSRNAEEGLRVGREITGAPLRRAQAVEAQKESGIQAQTDADNAKNATIHQGNQTEADKYNMEERDMRNQGYVQNQQAQAVQRRALAARAAGQVRPETMKPDDPANPVNGTWSGVDGTGKKVTGLAAPDSYLKTPAGKQAVIEQNIRDAKQAGRPYTPEQESVVRSGGHVTIKNPTNIRVPSAESEKYNDWKTSFARDNGRAPNAAEISSYGHQASGAMSKSLGARIETQKNSQINAARKTFNDSLNSAKGKTDQKDAADLRATALDTYTSEWQNAQDDYEQQLHDATGADVPHVVVKDNVDENGVWHGKAAAQPQQGQPQGSQQPSQSGSSATMAVPNPKGLVQAGNLPIWNRPVVQNSDGSHSSEYSVSFDDGGKEVLVPTVVNGKFLTPDGKKPPEGSAQEKQMFQRAFQHYRQTGEHLGKFDSPANADSYAQALHNRGQRDGQQGQQPQSFQYKGSTYTVGKPVTVDGKQYIVKGVNSQTGKPIVGAQ